MFRRILGSNERSRHKNAIIQDLLKRLDLAYPERVLLAEANNFPSRCRYESRFATDFQTLLAVLILTMGFLMAGCAKDNQILGHVIAQSASRLNMVNLKTLHASTRLATPAISI